MSTKTVADAAMRYFEARNARNAARKAFAAWCAENLGDDHQRCEAPDEQRGMPCYLFHAPAGPSDEWCPRCTERQPHWQAYREAAKASSQAMSALRGACARNKKQGTKKS